MARLDREPRLDADDIQGKIAPGFARQCELFTALRFETRAAGRRLAAAVAPLLAPMSTVFAHKVARKEVIAGIPRALR